MKTIGQRLYFTLGSVLLCLILGMGFTLWLERHDANQAATATKRNAQIGMGVRQMRLEMYQMSDAMRGMLLDPKNEKERQRKLAADENFDKAVDGVKNLLTDNPDLVGLLEKAGDFDTKVLNPEEEKVCSLLTTNAAAALEIYEKSYLGLRQQQMAILDEFADKAEKLSEQEVSRAETARNVGLGIIGGVILLAILIG
ncbi:MAG TPA: hypothetical protein VF607_03765, partial [Verrucomicrobiae bacterium]